MSKDKYQIRGKIQVRKVTIGNNYENDEINFRDRRDNSFVMFCGGIRELNDDLRKIKKCDVEEAVCDRIGKCEVYSE